jgi:hypothetical protein
VDNDADADYPGCRSLTSSPENPQCKDGLNNDNAAGIDFDGGASRDLDQDGFIDAQFNPATPAVGAADPQCTAAWMNREAAAPSVGGCGVGPELAALLPLLSALRRARRRP